MGLIRQSDARPDQPFPGVSRLTFVDRSTGAGHLTTRIVTVEPGATMSPHWHRVEEAMMVLEGSARATLGTETFEVRAGQTLLGPANVPHGFVNPGPAPFRIAVAFPAVDVETFPA